MKTGAALKVKIVLLHNLPTNIPNPIQSLLSLKSMHYVCTKLRRSLRLKTYRQRTVQARQRQTRPDKQMAPVVAPVAKTLH